MKAIDLIASALNRRDEGPNEELAKEILSSSREDWVKELVENLDNKDKNIQSDCIKVLYEIGEHGGSKLIAPYWSVFVKKLNSENNRLIWGVMAAINFVTLEKPDELFAHFPEIEAAIDKGSVITIDGGVSVLAKLASIKKYQKTVLPKLIGQLAKCPPKQFPMYIEKSEVTMNSATKDDFIGIIQLRYADLDKESQRRRVDKMLKKLNNL
jgi:hypothetical protein